MKYSENDLAALIGEVEDEFRKHLNKAEEEQGTELTKSEENSLEKEISADASNKIEKSEENFDYDENDYEEMDSLYSEMSKSEKEAHYKSIKHALFGSEEVKEEKIAKSEVKEEKIAKSENEVLKKENEELKKSIEGLTGALGKFLKGNSAPKRKAVTQLQYLKKSEESNEEKSENDVSKLSKTEINKILTSKIRSGEIKKAEDKEAISAFCLNNNPIETIKHLL